MDQYFYRFILYFTGFDLVGQDANVMQFMLDKLHLPHCF